MFGSKLTMWCTEEGDQPINWAYNLVIVEKKNDFLCLYLDLDTVMANEIKLCSTKLHKILFALPDIHKLPY